MISGSPTEMVEPRWPVTDGVVILRAATSADIPTLLTGRDTEWERWLGPGGNEPRPTACIVVGAEVVGWVDYDTDHASYLSDVDEYWEVFDPYKRTDPLAGRLSDDLADIYRDVRRGLDLLQDGGPLNEALWVWRFDFWNHWSDHAADALRALRHAARKTDV